MQKMKVSWLMFVSLLILCNLAQGEKLTKITCSGETLDINSENAVAQPVTRDYTYDKRFIYINDIKISCLPEVDSLRKANGGKFVICHSTLKVKQGNVDVRLELDRLVSGLFDLKLSHTQFLIGSGSTTKFQGLCGFVDP